MLVSIARKGIDILSFVDLFSVLVRDFYVTESILEYIPQSRSRQLTFVLNEEKTKKL